MDTSSVTYNTRVNFCYVTSSQNTRVMYFVVSKRPTFIRIGRKQDIIVCPQHIRSGIRDCMLFTPTNKNPPNPLCDCSDACQHHRICWPMAISQPEK
jgi:hypothetical protein